MTPRISIVIPLHVAGERFFADLDRFGALDYANYEILVVTDRPAGASGLRVREVLTGKTQTGPAEKRDIALPHCTGEICAFIDDDAYPDSQWLRNALQRFEQDDVMAVGGPGLTPPEDRLLARAGGAVYESTLGSGGNAYRFRPAPSRDVDDYPAYNLLIRKSALEAVGGFASTFYGGEDTKVCLAIVRAGGRIVYDPGVIVYHHRRPLFASHMRQIYNVGLHRGFFVKAFPETSRRPIYFLPLAGLAVAAIAAGAAAIEPRLRPAVAIGFVAWCGAAFFSAWVASRDAVIAMLGSAGIIATHVTYAVAFLHGLTLRRLDR